VAHQATSSGKANEAESRLDFSRAADHHINPYGCLCRIRRGLGQIFEDKKERFDGHFCQ